ncbi:MAG TPA: hypothetical protein VGE98_01045 [Thermoanaerobaculia bacterium]
MKKSRMERLNDPLFQPLTTGEAASTSGAVVITNHISFIPTDGANPDEIIDRG